LCPINQYGLALRLATDWEVNVYMEVPDLDHRR
jgi:hypothetical protein